MGSGWQSFFQLSKSERIGMTLLVLLLIAWLSSDWWMLSRTEAPQILNDELQALLSAVDSATEAEKLAHSGVKSADSLFYFDINTIDSVGMSQLGLSSGSIRGLLRYRAGGGRVRSENDFEKLFSLTADDKARLKPWLRIEPLGERGSPMQTYGREAEKAKATFAPIALNQADSLALLRVPGIGPAFASRILRYRERLGGFTTSLQLLEVFGVDSARYQQWEPFLEVSPLLRLLYINTDEEESLAAHPYFGKLRARRVVAYRKQHGHIRSAEALYRIHGLDSADIARVLPYLSFEAAQ
jgi:competence protein ComEA